MRGTLGAHIEAYDKARERLLRYIIDEIVEAEDRPLFRANIGNKETTDRLIEYARELAKYGF